ncbi:hypothetical protein [Halorubrum sp. BV1]|uniref:hypothetical protein n=1 Tax=Halorubrum sp. BV1 TaxID=1498500 RepID=UPI000678B88F|nr:hypothetical protein [Halorubrum sp. BV1]
MTGPYRLRDAFGDKEATWQLAMTVASAIGLGLAPAVAADLSFGPALTVLYFAFWTGMLLKEMNTTDSRLREVSSA